MIHSEYNARPWCKENVKREWDKKMELIVKCTFCRSNKAVAQWRSVGMGTSMKA